MWPNVCNGPAFKTWTAESQFGLKTFANLTLILWYHDRIEIDTSFSVVVVTPQTPKCHHNLCASAVVTFGVTAMTENELSVPSTLHGIMYTSIVWYKNAASFRYFYVTLFFWRVTCHTYLAITIPLSPERSYSMSSDKRKHVFLDPGEKP